MPTKIEWSEETWNPTQGCTRVSDGCTNCYIERTPPFRMAGRRFDRPGVNGTTGVTLHPDRLDKPLRWRKPRRIFVNSMSDLFHDEVPDAFIAEVFAVMHYARQYTFQVLTKRHGRMRALLKSDDFFQLVWEAAERMDPDGHLCKGFPPDNWPLPNVWLGVSVEDQKWADIRIPALLETPAAVRWLSCEPLLGPVDLKNVAPGLVYVNAGFSAITQTPSRIDWTVIGGESGPGARSMDLNWAQLLVDQCREAGVPAFVKQLGSRWGKNHHDIEAFPESLQVREYPQAVS